MDRESIELFCSNEARKGLEGKKDKQFFKNEALLGFGV